MHTIQLIQLQCKKYSNENNRLSLIHTVVITFDV